MEASGVKRTSDQSRCHSVKILTAIRSHLPAKTRIMAILKGGTYGIGRPVELAHFLSRQGIDIFGFAFVDEAVQLRRAGFQNDLFVLNAIAGDAEKVVTHKLQAAAGDLATLTAFETQGKVKIHLNINTGMNRLGCPLHEAAGLAEYIQMSKNLTLEAVMSHLPAAENPLHDTFTLRQIQEIIATAASLKESGIEFPWTHIHNSAGALRFTHPEFNLVRIGLIMYGIHPSPETRKTLPLVPALTLRSRIVSLNRINRGDSVSYGRTYKAEANNTLIATVPIGYFDGLHRCYSNRASVLVKGEKAKIAGTICMDFMMINVSSIPNVQVGDTVTLFGQDDRGNELTPEEFAASGNTVAHELITCMGPRIKRNFLGSLGDLPLEFDHRNVSFCT